MNRDNFIRELESLLISRNFIKSDNVYSYKQIQQRPGRSISINGQMIQEPPQEIQIEFIIKDNGEGWVSNTDDTNKQYFTQLKYEIHQNNEIVKEIEYCLYHDTIINEENILNLFNK